VDRAEIVFRGRDRLRGLLVLLAPDVREETDQSFLVENGEIEVEIVVEVVGFDILNLSGGERGALSC